MKHKPSTKDKKAEHPASDTDVTHGAAEDSPEERSVAHAAEHEPERETSAQRATVESAEAVAEESPTVQIAAEERSHSPSAPDRGVMESAAEGLAEGVSAAQAAASRFIPGASGLVSKAVYNTAYYLSYGVVFGALAATAWIPTDNKLGEGIHDGTEAAKKAFQETFLENETERADVPAEDAAATA
jgi:hypothetical protein